MKCECNIVNNEKIEIKEPKKVTAKSIANSFYDVLKYLNYKVLRCYKLVFRGVTFTKNVGSILTYLYFIGFILTFVFFCYKKFAYLNEEFEKLFENYENSENMDKDKSKDKDIDKEKNNDKDINKDKDIEKENNIEKDKDIENDKNIDKDKDMNNNKDMSKDIDNDIIKDFPVIFEGKKENKEKIIFEDIKKDNLKSNNDNEKQVKNKIIKNDKKGKIDNRYNKKVTIDKNKNNSKKSESIKESNNDRSKIKLLNNKVNKNIIINKLTILDDEPLSVDPINRKMEEIKEEEEVKEKVEEKIEEKKEYNIEIKPKKEIKKKEELLSDYELNDLEYLDAIELDKRNFLKIYFYYLKREHLIFFTFFNPNDFNLFSIKLSKIFLSICTYMAFNVFFFSDESMHNVYTSGGEHDFFGQLAQMIYSTIIGQLLQIFINYLTMTDIQYYQLKELLKEQNLNKNQNIRIMKIIKYKIIIFYSFTFLLFMFFWYLISAFCAVYENTQIIFVTDSLTSFSMEQLYPFILYLIPAGLRLLSLRRKNLKFVYCLSDKIPFF